LQDVARRKLIAYAAIAGTLGAAWAAAFDAARRTSRLPVVIPPGSECEFLQRLPVESLRLPFSIIETLRELDLCTIRQLQQLPRETLPSRFGPELLLRLDQALGRVPESIVPVRCDEPVEARWGSEEPIDNGLAIEAILKRLLRRVVRGTSSRGEGILRLAITLACVEREPLQISIACLRSTACCKQLFDLVRLQLERLQTTQGVVDFLVRATSTAPLQSSQPVLFGEREQRDNNRELDVLLNRLSSRLGRSAVLRPKLRADHQPERAADFQPVIGASTEESREAAVSQQRCRPVRLLPQPVPVTVISVVPDGPPIRILQHNADQQIIYCEGPERIEIGWWREGHIRRDYYRVDTDSGERYWLFRSLNDDHWFLHGEF